MMLNHQKQTVCNSCKEYQYVSSGQMNESLEIPGMVKRTWIPLR